MRIRKIVSRLLGAAMASSTTYPTSSSDQQLHPSPNNYQNLSAPAAMEVSLSGVVLCELNQSPWDVYPNLHLFNTDLIHFQDLEPSIISKKEETKKVILENTGCVLENAGAILKNSEHPIPVCQKPTRRTPKKKKEKIRKKEAIVVVPCKKNDGKKWFCKRPAKPPNSMCEYHLSQSRSYYNTNKLEKEASQYHAMCESAKRKHKSRDNGASGGASPYYYYNGYGPSTRKRRRVDVNDNGVVRDDIMHLADDGILDLRDALDIDLDEECDGEIAGELASDPNEGRRFLRKRGRKPVKCRSLKSLL